MLGETNCKEREDKMLVEDMFFSAGRRHDENVVDKIKKNLKVLRLQKLKRSIKPIRHFKNGPRNSIMYLVPNQPSGSEPRFYFGLDSTLGIHMQRNKLTEADIMLPLSCPCSPFMFVELFS
ncbi:hypothetical protein P8452_17052 [Trifolium repens]|nr:hypothetical protein P8452_17052 [Trifolium repens]